MTPQDRQFLEILDSLGKEGKACPSVYIAKKLNLPRTSHQSYMNMARLGRLRKAGLVRAIQSEWDKIMGKKYWTITDKGRETLRIANLQASRTSDN